MFDKMNVRKGRNLCQNTVARKYNVDFAVKKDKTTEPPKYLVFFKGRDADAVAQAFKEFVYGNGGINGLFATHPPIEKRIEILEQF